MPQNPYHNVDNKPVLRRSVFVFMDILGYSEMIKRSEHDGTQQDLMDHLYKSLELGRSWLEEKQIPLKPEIDDYALKAFTDNIVIGWPVTGDAESEFGTAFFKIAYFQLHMVLNGFFLRGALTIDDVYIDDIAVFGKALTETYQAEARLARDPRIILTPSAVSTIREHLKYYASPAVAPQTRDLLQDSDGQWFLNYLDLVLMAENEAGPFYKEIFEHKKIIEKQLNDYKSEPQIWAKYSWLASYHNYFCDSHPRYFNSEHKIELELYRSTPSPIF